MPDFEINTHEIGGGVTLVNVYGFLDAHTFEFVQSQLDQLFADGCHRIVINLTDVDYISSAGAGVFIGALTTAQEHGGNIVLMNPQTAVQEVFDLLGLSQVFLFAKSEAEAVAAFSR